MAILPHKIDLEVITPQREVLRQDVNSVELPGRDGYLGILPGHAPLITELGIGVLNYRAEAAVRHLSVIQGYAEVLPDRVIVLAEVSERAEEIDVKRAEAARDRAQQLLTKPSEPEVDWRRASAALARSLARLEAASKGSASPE